MTNVNLLLLPLDILAIIFNYLKTTDLRNVMLTCKYLNNIVINETRLWRSRIQNGLLIQFKSDQKFTLYDRCRVSHNWRKGIFRNKVIIQHATSYMPWLQFHESKYLFLSVGANLQCYSVDRKGLQQNILWSTTVPTVERGDIRTNDISRFIHKENFIVCGNRDGSVAVYELKDYTKKPLLLAHIENCHDNGLVEVSAVEIISNTIVTISNNSPTIAYWKCENLMTKSDTVCGTTLSLTGDVGCRCMAMSKLENQLAIGLNGNSKPLLLDVTTNKVLISPSEAVNRKQVVRDIRWRSEHTFVYVTHSGKLEMVDTRTGRTTYETTDPFLSSLYCVRTDEDNAVVVGSSEYSRCVLYDLRQTDHVQIYFSQKKMSPVYSLDFDTRKLFAAADRGVAALNFNVSTATTRPRDYSDSFQCIA